MSHVGLGGCDLRVGDGQNLKGTSDVKQWPLNPVMRLATNESCSYRSPKDDRSETKFFLSLEPTLWAVVHRLSRNRTISGRI